jgi:hypothetical protein
MKGKMESGVAKPLLSQYTETESQNTPKLPAL